MLKYHQEHPSSQHTLRLVLIVALDREVAAACLGYSSDEAFSLWPSGVYGALALAATESPLVWRRCRLLLDASFADAIGPFERVPAIEVAERFTEGRAILPVFDLAAMLWSLCRRSERALEPMVARLGAELEVVATGRQQDVETPRTDARRSSGAACASRPIALTHGL